MNDIPLADQPTLDDPVRPGPLQRPAVLALLLSGVYTLLSVIYIRISSVMAAGLSGSVEELQAIEELKGVLFVVFSGVVLFCLSWALLRALQHRNSELLRSRNVLFAGERLAVAGMFASSMAHDINNILTVAQGNLDLLGESPTLSVQDRDLLVEIDTACQKLGAMSRRLMQSARQNTAGTIENVDLVPVIREVLDFARSHRRVKLRSLAEELPASLPLKVNHPLLTRALLNLIINAADATAEGGRILVVLDRREDWAVLQVHDDGPGVPVQAADHIFEPFYTSKPDGNGLGLLSVRNCAQEHGGSASVVASRLGGAAFELRMPLAVAATRPTSQPGHVSF